MPGGAPVPAVVRTAARSCWLAALLIWQLTDAASSLKCGSCTFVVSDAGVLSRTGSCASDCPSLWLASKGIKTIEAKVFDGLSGLNSLYLGSNQLSALAVDTFYGAWNLQTLSLDNNGLESLPSKLFDGFNQLRYLSLSSNKLSTLQAHMFQGLTSLSILYVESNLISGIQAEAFSQLSGLSLLYLGKNQISVIEISAFKGLSSLSLLHLNNNQISNLQSNTFAELTRLNQLRLDYNQITSLQENVFTGMPYLQSLQLENNKLTTLQPGVFNLITRLEVLQLYNNLLTSIRPGVFDVLTNLQKLYLYKNSISCVATNAFANLKKITFLDIQSNPIPCRDPSWPSVILVKSGLEDCKSATNCTSAEIPITVKPVVFAVTFELTGAQFAGIRDQYIVVFAGAAGVDRAMVRVQKVEDTTLRRGGGARHLLASGVVVLTEVKVGMADTSTFNVDKNVLNARLAAAGLPESKDVQKVDGNQGLSTNVFLIVLIVCGVVFMVLVAVFGRYLLPKKLAETEMRQMSTVTAAEANGSQENMKPRKLFGFL
eukprot:762828-Hanusia_phi.AAC.1